MLWHPLSRARSRCSNGLKPEVRHRVHRDAECTEKKSRRDDIPSSQICRFAELRDEDIRGHSRTGCAIKVPKDPAPAYQPIQRLQGPAAAVGAQGYKRVPIGMRTVSRGQTAPIIQGAYIYYSARVKRAIRRSPPEGRSRTRRLRPRLGRHRSLRNGNESINICGELSFIGEICKEPGVIQGHLYVVST